MNIDFGEPWFKIDGDRDNDLEIVADVGKDKLRVPIAKFKRNVNKKRRGNLPCPAALAARAVICVNACKGYDISEIQVAFRLLRKYHDWKKANQSK